MWEFNKKDALMLLERREHALKLPGIIIPAEVVITNSVADIFENAEMIVCVVPSQTMRSTLKLVVSSVAPARLAAVDGWIIASKGIECETLKLMSEVLMEEVPGLTEEKIVVLSGPSHAEEVSRAIPTTVVAASKSLALSVKIQEAFSTETFRIYTNSDVAGVELAASVKNVIALAAGISDGLGLGDNTKGALLTRGMVEMIRLGKKMGAEEQTFFGLAGIGDLITTCISRHSRNRNMGELIASGLSLKEALAKMVMVAEGVETTKSVYQLSKKFNIEMPITVEVYKALFENESPKQAIKNLMMRQFRPERW
jgi:glycerol-3-phosphate dehydrogenase (NAD(P)+)